MKRINCIIKSTHFTTKSKTGVMVIRYMTKRLENCSSEYHNIKSVSVKFSGK